MYSIFVICYYEIQKAFELMTESINKSSLYFQKDWLGNFRDILDYHTYYIFSKIVM